MSGGEQREEEGGEIFAQGRAGMHSSEEREEGRGRKGEGGREREGREERAGGHVKGEEKDSKLAQLSRKYLVQQLLVGIRQCGDHVLQLLVRVDVVLRVLQLAHLRQDVGHEQPFLEVDAPVLQRSGSTAAVSTHMPTARR